MSSSSEAPPQMGELNAATIARSSGRLPNYGVVGLLIMTISEAAMLIRLEPFWSWHTPVAWTGYILFIDGFVRSRTGSSWLTTNRGEFVLLATASVPLWLVFEFFNLFIRNWHYINLPESLFWRNFGYAWAFATIWPAIFETADAASVWRGTAGRGSPSFIRARPVRALETTLIAMGATLLLWPLVWPSPYLAAPVWLGFIFLLDPVNARFGGESLLEDSYRGRFDRAANLALGGLICGFLWEFWNYWARTKWIYDVPILPDVKLFEMPLPGYLGFPAFALECFTMYVTLRLLIWRGRGRPIPV